MKKENLPKLPKLPKGPENITIVENVPILSIIKSNIKTKIFEKEKIKKIRNGEFSHDTNCSCKDRDRNEIKDGEIKYFRENGRLMKGEVYHKINNMKWVILNDRQYKSIYCGDLFDLKDEDLLVRKEIDKDKTAKMNPRSYKNHNQEYRIGDNIFILNENSGFFKANTDFGSYCHYWFTHDMKSLLTEVSKNYFLNKVTSCEYDKVVDFKYTKNKWLEEIEEALTDKCIEKSNFDELKKIIENGFENNNSIYITLYELEEYIDAENLDVCCDFSIHYKFTDKVESFYKIFSTFVKILKAEIKEEEK